MARPTNKDKELKEDIESLRKKVIRQFFGLSPKMYNHIEASMEATMPCTACMKVDGVHKPGKAVDAEGKCAQCHGTYLIPHLAQRNWATEQAKPIIAPAPKQVDVAVSEGQSLDEIQKEVSGLSDEELAKLDKKLDLTSLSTGLAVNDEGN